MFPTIFEIAPFVLFGIQFGPFALHTYGLFVAAGFLLGIAWSMREARERGLDPDLLSDLGFYIILGAILGARILYVLINPVYYWHNPQEILMFWKGGLVFSGGAILATVFALVYLKRKKQDIWQWMDTLVPGIGLGEAVGRIGCLSAGCCYGAACDLPWAITFSHPESLAPLFVPLHPTQIYHSLAGLICFAVAISLKRRLPHSGWLMGIFLIMFAAFRFVIELFRSDYRGDFGPISVTQLIALGAIALGCFIIYSRRRHVSR
ncbi:MAG: prolipoprotein diacylglyceryl transferase [Deltaproteobacteria bacterium]|nr:prolipoprotein diacylglyceryl transferase [Deltaproteobacteria bacterium]